MAQVALTGCSDHEFADNEYVQGTPDGVPGGGSADSNNTASGYVNGLPFSQRRANAIRAYFEWIVRYRSLPLMPKLTSYSLFGRLSAVRGTRLDRPRSQQTTDGRARIWRSFSIGTLGDMIFLDVCTRLCLCGLCLTFLADSWE